MKQLAFIIGLLLHIMKRLAFFNFLVFTFFIASCTGDKEVRAVLDKAEGYLPDYPDSACAVLDSVPTSLLSREGLALYGLLRTMTDAMEGKGVTTDSLIRPSYIYYKERSGTDENIRRLGRSAFYLARFEASRDSTKRAEDLYREAIRYAEQVEDWRTCYMAYSHLADEKTWSDKAEAISLLNTAIDIYQQVDDKPANLISMLLSLSNNHLALRHYDLAFDCANNAYNIARKDNLEPQTSEALRSLSIYYYETGNYPKALELAKQGMQGLTDQTRDAALFSLADCFLACDSLEQAKTTLLFIKSSDNRMRYAVSRKLSQIAMLQHDSQLAASYSDSTYQAVVSIFSESQHQKELYYKSLIVEELANGQLSYRNQTLRYTVIIIILVVVILVLISYRRIKAYISQMNEKHRLNMLSRETLISELQARVHQYNEQVTQNKQTLNRYQQLLEQKQNELQQLKTQEANTEEFQAKQQRYTQDIIALKQLYLDEKEQNQTIIKEQQQKIIRLQHLVIKQTDVYRDIVNGQVKLKDLDSGYWQEVEFILDSLSNRFATRLKNEFPKLTEEQYHLCLLSRMGLTRNQVASLMCLEGDTIKKKYQECKRSVFGITGQPVNFNDLIAQL